MKPKSGRGRSCVTRKNKRRANEELGGGGTKGKGGSCACVGEGEGYVVPPAPSPAYRGGSDCQCAAGGPRVGWTGREDGR